MTNNAIKKLLINSLMLFTLLLSINNFANAAPLLETIAFKDLPRDAQQTVLLIKRGGPFPYEKDGAVFGNYESALPKHERGYYHEFTVRTPGERSRGARRIVIARPISQPLEFYYTDDHYATFKRIIE